MRTAITLAADNPLEHVVDKTLVSVPGGSGPFSTLLSLHMVTLAFTSVLLVFIMLHVARSIREGTDDGAGRYVAKGRFAQAIEVTCAYLRNQIVEPQLGPATDKFIGYIWTVFFFILISNLFGLVPLIDLQHLFGLHTVWLGGTATGNIAVTGVLALIAFAIMQVNGLRNLGVIEWAKHFTAGAPAYLWPIMIPVEILGTFIKPFALAVRLFANMVAGHTLLATLMMFTKMALTGLGLFLGAGISIVSVAAALPLMFLEILVAFIQAFIFTLLTTVFIAQLMHHHEEHEHEEHAHAQAVPA